MRMDHLVRACAVFNGVAYVELEPQRADDV
jgi:hypothetical protein